MDPSGRRWISPAECAEYLHVHIKSVYMLCRERKLPATRLPAIRGHGGRGRVLIDRQGLDRLLEEGLVPVAEELLDKRRRARR